MSMRFTEIGQQLRAYRLESGLRAEEIAARLGVSRAALYRYEKGEVIKLDTIKRLAELLKSSPLSRLGIGVEYYNRPIGYFERVLERNPAGDRHLAGDALSYADLSMFQVIAGLDFAFPRAMRRLSPAAVLQSCMSWHRLGVITVKRAVTSGAAPKATSWAAHEGPRSV